MKMLTRADLYGLEQYAMVRTPFRARVMAHKKTRFISVGPHATLQFEDRLTVQYQIQEMLRAERLYQADEVQGELDAYNPLIPDGDNWKATLLLEYTDAAERGEQLTRLIHIEDRVWVRVSDHAMVYAIADEDMPRATHEKTSAVHFLRFPLLPTMVTAVKAGAAIAVGIDHAHYHHVVDPIAEPVRASLALDLGFVE